MSRLGKAVRNGRGQQGGRNNESSSLCAHFRHHFRYRLDPSPASRIKQLAVDRGAMVHTNVDFVAWNGRSRHTVRVGVSPDVTDPRIKHRPHHHAEGQK